MSLNRNSLFALLAGTLALSLTGCGRPPVMVPARAAVTAASLKSQSVPSANQFVTVQATVVAVLPNDTTGLPHQNFVVTVDGHRYFVNNDTHYGTEVPGLKVGMQLTIRGVEYHDPKDDGIHWTHHADRDGDAGYIQTADGHIYQ